MRALSILRRRNFYPSTRTCFSWTVQHQKKGALSICPNWTYRVHDNAARKHSFQRQGLCLSYSTNSPLAFPSMSSTQTRRTTPSTKRARHSSHQTKQKRQEQGRVHKKHGEVQNDTAVSWPRDRSHYKPRIQIQSSNLDTYRQAIFDAKDLLSRYPFSQEYFAQYEQQTHNHTNAYIKPRRPSREAARPIPPSVKNQMTHLLSTLGPLWGRHAKRLFKSQQELSTFHPRYMSERHGYGELLQSDQQHNQKQNQNHNTNHQRLGTLMKDRHAVMTSVGLSSKLQVKEQGGSLFHVPNEYHGEKKRVNSFTRENSTSDQIHPPPRLNPQQRQHEPPSQHQHQQAQHMPKYASSRQNPAVAAVIQDAVQTADALVHRLLEEEERDLQGWENADPPQSRGGHVVVHENDANTARGSNIQQDTNDKSRRGKRVNRRGWLTSLLNACNMAINGWAKSGLPVAPERALAILRRMERLSDKHHHNNNKNSNYFSPTMTLIPNLVTYNSTLHALAKNGDPKRAPFEVQRLLDHMEELYKAYQERQSLAEGEGEGQGTSAKQGSNHRPKSRSKYTLSPPPRPDQRSYNMLIDAWANSTHPQRGTQGEAILTTMEHLADSHQNPSARPDCVSYSTAISCWESLSRTHPHDLHSMGGVSAAAKRAEELLDRMEGRRKKMLQEQKGERRENLMDADALQPNRITYSSLVHLWCRAKQRGSVQRAQDVLEWMVGSYLNRCKASNNDISNTGKPQRAQTPHKKRQTSWNQTHLHHADLRPRLVDFDLVLNAWTKSGEPDAGQKAEELLMKLEDLSMQPNLEHLRPSTKTYTIVINAWARSIDVVKENGIMGDSGGENDGGGEGQKVRGGALFCAQRAQGLLDRMEEWDVPEKHSQTGHRHHHQQEKQQPHCTPNRVTYNAVIDAWSRCAAKMENSDVAPMAAEALLRRMQESAKRHPNMRPNVITYTGVLMAWAKSSHHISNRSTSKVEDIHLEMEERYMETKDDLIKPDTISYTAVVSAIAKSGASDAPQRAEAVVRRMEEFGRENMDAAPNAVTYNSLIHAWTISDQPNAMYRAVEILDQMTKMHRDGRFNVKPDLVSYLTVLHGYAAGNRDKDSGVKAEAMLDKMLSESTSGDGVEPNTDCFDLVICAYAHAGDFRGALAVARRLEGISKMHPNLAAVTPTLVTYNNILHACALFDKEENNDVERMEALRVALSTFRLVQSSPVMTPNEATFNILLRICSSLTSNEEEKRNSFKDLFRLCCDEGMVCRNFLLELRKVSRNEEEDYFWDVIGEKYRQQRQSSNGEEIVDFFDYERLPHMWKRNVTV